MPNYRFEFTIKHTGEVVISASSRKAAEDLFCDSEDYTTDKMIERCCGDAHWGIQSVAELPERG